MRNIFITIQFVSVLFLLSCKKRSIADPGDYSAFLRPDMIREKYAATQQEKEFWTLKLLQDTGSYIYKLELARTEFSLFKLKGNIQSLHKGDSLLKNASAKLDHSDPEILFALAQNNITHHRFSEAAITIQRAWENQGDRYTIALLQFDSWMELGEYGKAFKALQSLRDRNSFDYLLRRAKWEDHQGRLDQAILYMEHALEKVKNKKKSLYSWALSNLADMYGHAGRIREAYESFIEVLQQDPTNLYCLKGIAWIVLSHDQNPEEAKRIITFILSQTDLPELKLWLAEIATQQNDPKRSYELKSSFADQVGEKAYGDMYNKYLIQIFSEQKDKISDAIRLAQKEIKNRFTPETCDLLAWSLYKNGDIATAYEFATKYVFNHTSEPDAMMHTAFIYASKGKKTEARKLLESCLESSFELGPGASREVQEKLSELSSQ